MVDGDVLLAYDAFKRPQTDNFSKQIDIRRKASYTSYRDVLGDFVETNKLSDRQYELAIAQAVTKKDAR
ncbi:hypothetical protein KIN20_009550 [Parelaphostrongylus tenuis]|uniref:Uncharacterized protein n=1 Tax=Parelaphostrongylus tenuis TaxID=148309 RepID=A0AAD5M6I2_PARTN|nr:hypothetical protein KIN20_009550 [Parelaphostrongylus tenuis]